MNNKRGFTLIEVISVLAIMGLLATIIVASYMTLIKSSRKGLNEEQKSRLVEVAKNVSLNNKTCLELAKNARPVDSEKEELYKFWKDAGYKTFGRFSKEHICIELEEKEDKYFYQYYVYYKQGCYTGTCHWYERDYVNNNISNKELGHHIIEQMNSVKGQSFKKWTKYIWDGSTWINNKTKK